MMNRHNRRAQAAKSMPALQAAQGALHSIQQLQQVADQLQPYLAQLGQLGDLVSDMQTRIIEVEAVHIALQRQLTVQQHMLVELLTPVLGSAERVRDTMLAIEQRLETHEDEDQGSAPSAE